MEALWAAMFADEAEIGLVPFSKADDQLTREVSRSSVKGLAAITSPKAVWSQPRTALFSPKPGTALSTCFCTTVAGRAVPTIRLPVAR